MQPPTKSFVHSVILLLVLSFAGCLELELLPNECTKQFKVSCTSGECISTSQINNGVKDCEDGSDEGDYIMTNETREYWNNRYPKNPEIPSERTDCGVAALNKCSCNNSHIYCEKANLTEIPPDLFADTTMLYMMYNHIPSIRCDDFKNLRNLKVLYFTDSQLEVIEERAFYNCSQLKSLNLVQNSLNYFSSDVFAENNTLEELDLRLNSLEIVRTGSFSRFTRLKKLDLSENKIKVIMPGAFADCTELLMLILESNNIDAITTGSFDDLIKLRNLYLDKNRINHIDSGSFVSLQSLKSMGMSSNYLRRLNNGTLSGLNNVTFLDIRSNGIEYIEAGAFVGLTSVKYLHLTGNNFYEVTVGTFDYMTDLEYIHFSAFYLCAYVQTVKTCRPTGDGISTIANLLESSILRIVIWVVGIVACVGNFAVLMGRCVLKKDNQIHSFFIKNLSVADLLMGIYLLVIGGHDQWFRGEYLKYDFQWRNSWSCDVTGLVSTISSEASVLTLTVITLDRYICVTYPLSLRKINIKLAYGIMGVIWLFTIMLAVLPVTGMTYFGASFYRQNAVCVPLMLHESTIRGWEYSAFLFVGINVVSIIFLAYAYISMFLTMRNARFRSLHQTQDKYLMKRFFLIVITDVACWVPIILLKIAALAGAKFPMDVYAWIVVFVLPVNCAINPLLYTLITKIFKQKFLVRFKVMLWKGRSYQDSTSTSVSIIKSRSSKKDDVLMDQYPLQNETLNTIRAHEMRFKYGQGRTVYPCLTTHKHLQIGYTSVPSKI